MSELQDQAQPSDSSSSPQFAADADALRANVPPELAKARRWVAAQGKKPHSAVDGQASNWNQGPERWVTMEEALAFVEAHPEFDGVGYVFCADDRRVGLDLDNVIFDDGDLEPWASELLEELKATYVERSKGGRGLHAVVLAVWREGWRTSSNGRASTRSGSLEMYAQGRFFVITGDLWDGHPSAIADAPPGLLDRLQREFFGVEPAAVVAPEAAVKPTTASDDDTGESPPYAVTDRVLQYARGVLKKRAKRVVEVSQGDRNNTLNRAAFYVGRYVGAGVLEESTVRAALVEAAMACGLDTDREGCGIRGVEDTIESGLRAGRDKPINVEALDVELLRTAKRCTDTGNARRYVRLHGIDTRYVDEWGNFVLWTGRRWKRDAKSVGTLGRTADVVVDIGRAAARTRAEAENTTDDDERERLEEAAAALESWSHRTESAIRRRSIIQLLPSEGSRISHEELDAKPMLLNLRNGTLDLKTGKLREHDRDDLLTHCCPVAWNPQAECPRWREFLKRVLPDPEARGVMQRAGGYSLTGDVSEQDLFLLLGDGQNGKTTFVSPIQWLLGPSLSCVVPPRTFLAGASNTHPTTIASLHGKRFAVSSDEASGGDRWDPARVKQLTGGDRLTARRMKEDFWEFCPSHKLWVLANSFPAGASGPDAFAMLRRIVVVKFDVIIPDAEVDKHLPEALQREARGILVWLVQGASDWLRGGLAVPEHMRRLTDEMRGRLDPVGAFIEECIESAPGEDIPARELHQAYTAWAQAKGIQPGSETAFGRLAKDKLTRAERVGGRAYVDVRLKGADRKGQKGVEYEH